MKFGMAVNKSCWRTDLLSTLPANSFHLDSWRDRAATEAAVDVTNRKALSNCASFNVRLSMRRKCGRGSRQALSHSEDGRKQANRFYWAAGGICAFSNTWMMKSQLTRICSCSLPKPNSETSDALLHLSSP